MSGAAEPAVPEVLVLRALGLGDLLAAVPALRGLRRGLPGRRLVLAAPEPLGGWFVGLGLADEVLPTAGLHEPLAVTGRPEVAVNLHGRGPLSHRLLAATRPRATIAFACAAAGFGAGPTWREDEHEVDRWLRLVRVLGPVAGPADLRLPCHLPRGDHVVVHPGAAAPARRWPVGRWLEVVRALVRDGHHVVVTGTSAEADLGATLAGAGAEDRCGLDDLPALADVVGAARLLLSADTGVAHLATALATPSVTLFGPVSPDLWGPRTDLHLHRVLWAGDPAAPRPGDPHGTEVDALLAALTVEEVLAEARDLLDTPQAVRASSAAAAPRSSSRGS